MGSPPSSLDDRWTCGECGGLNPANRVVCGSCEQPLGEGARVEVAGVELAGRDWMTLLLAQLWVFFSVAGADGRVDDAEVSRLRYLDRGDAERDDPLLGAMASALRADFWGVVDRHTNDRRSVQTGLSEVRSILDEKLSAPRAAGLRVGLVRLGVAVAAASGLGFLGLGRRIRDEEASVLTKVSDALGLSEEERRRAELPPSR